MNKRICVYCGAEFIGAITARYCGQSCMSAAQRQRNQRNSGDPYTVTETTYKATCAHCGQGFNPKHPARRYCSDACKMKAYRARQARKVVQ